MWKQVVVHSVGVGKRLFAEVRLIQNYNQGDRDKWQIEAPQVEITLVRELGGWKIKI